MFPGEPVTLRGIARDTIGRELPDDSFVWRLDGEPIAVGNGASALLPPGERQLSLQATASNGLSGQASITLQVPGPDGDGDGVPDEQDSCPNSLPGSLVTVADCPTDVENRLDGNGCALEELVNTTLEQNGREALVELLKVLRKNDQLDKTEVKAIKKCVIEEDGD